MARRRRPGSRTSVVDGRAAVVIPVDVLVDADGEPMRFGGVKRWFRPITTFPSALPAAPDGASMLLDRFAYDLHLSDIGHSSDVHDGDAFVDAARAQGAVDVYIVDGLDPRRSKPEELAAAAASGRMLAGAVTSFDVDVLEP